MLNPLIIAMLDSLLETKEDVKTMSKPLEEWTDEELERMAKKAIKVMGAE